MKSQPTPYPPSIASAFVIDNFYMFTPITRCRNPIIYKVK